MHKLFVAWFSLAYNVYICTMYIQIVTLMACLLAITPEGRLLALSVAK